MILTYKDRNLFVKASAFMLAHPHGGNHPRLMSSFSFDDPNQGPPQDDNGNILSPEFDSNGQCSNGWVCEHRWPQIVKMLQFRRETASGVLTQFTNIAKDQITFCRGSKGFVAINNSNTTLAATVNACVPDGVYCDVISGDVVNGQCSGEHVIVRSGKASINLPADSDGILAIHTGAKTQFCACS
jgi:alpha-amylase